VNEKLKNFQLNIKPGISENFSDSKAESIQNWQMFYFAVQGFLAIMQIDNVSPLFFK